MDWQQFVMNLETLNPEEVEAIFTRHGAQSVTLRDAGDNPVLEPAPGETPLWTETSITGLFSPDADLAEMQRDLLATLGLQTLPAHRIDSLADRDWEREWLKDFGPMQFGERLWICPAGTDAPNSAVVVRLDPGLGFGTGTHPTTSLCLEWLDGLELSGRTLLDYGCGSGILAIAALKLGCASATALDIDPQALTATAQNAAENGVSERLTVLASDPGISRKFDIIVANILAAPLLELADSIASRLSSGGDLALSGILLQQIAEIQAAYEPWIEFDQPAIQAQGRQIWARLNGKRRVN